MAGLFVLLFFAALVGVFKPYINGVKRWQFGIAAFVAFMLTGIAGMETTGDSLKKEFETQEAAKPGTVKEANAAVAESSYANEPNSKWEYSEEKDEMRDGAITHLASLAGENTIDLDFPYGEQRGQILIRQSPKFGFDILVGVPSGQIPCSSYSNNYINAKFDDGPIERYSCNEASDGTNNMVFIEGSKGFLNNLKKSKKLIVEAEFFNNGVQQMTFDTSNLKWDH